MPNARGGARESTGLSSHLVVAGVADGVAMGLVEGTGLYPFEAVFQGAIGDGDGVGLGKDAKRPSAIEGEPILAGG